MTDHSQMTEFIGTAIGDTINLTIPGTDPSLVLFMRLGGYRSIGILGDRVAVGSQMVAVDETVRAADVELISMKASRDSKDGVGCGILFYIGANDISDARHAVEIALEQLPKQLGEVYVNDAGHLSFSYTARAGQRHAKTLGVVEGKASEVMCCELVAIGYLISNLVTKFTPVTVINYHHPPDNCLASEVMLCFIGGFAAVRQMLRTAVHAGKQLPGSLGEEPHSLGGPWTRKFLRENKRLP